MPTIELNADLSSSYSSIVPPILATLKLRESLNGTYADHFIVFSKDNAVIASDFNTQFGCSQGSEDKAEGLLRSHPIKMTTTTPSFRINLTTHCLS